MLRFIFFLVLYFVFRPKKAFADPSSIVSAVVPTIVGSLMGGDNSSSSPTPQNASAYQTDAQKALTNPLTKIILDQLQQQGTDNAARLKASQDYFNQGQINNAASGFVPGTSASVNNGNVGSAAGNITGSVQQILDIGKKAGLSNPKDLLNVLADQAIGRSSTQHTDDLIKSAQDSMNSTNDPARKKMFQGIIDGYNAQKQNPEQAKIQQLASAIPASTKNILQQYTADAAKNTKLQGGVDNAGAYLDEALSKDTGIPDFLYKATDAAKNGQTVDNFMQQNGGTAILASQPQIINAPPAQTSPQTTTTPQAQSGTPSINNTSTPTAQQSTPPAPALGSGDKTPVPAQSTNMNNAIQNNNANQTIGQSYQNPSFLAPQKATDYGGQLNVSTPAEEALMKQQALEQMQGKTGTSTAQNNDLITKANALLQNPEQSTKYVQNIADMAQGLGQGYTPQVQQAMIDAAVNPMTRAFKEQQDAMNASMAAKGFGNSTTTQSDLINPVLKEYLGKVGDIGNTVVAQNAERQLAEKTAGANIYNQAQNAQNAGQTQNFNNINNTAGLVNQGAALNQQAIGNLQNVLATQQAREQYNIAMPYQEWQNRNAADQQTTQNAIGILNGQTPAQIANMNNSNSIWQANNANQAATNGTWGNAISAALTQTKPAANQTASTTSAIPQVNTNTPAVTAANAFTFGSSVPTASNGMYNGLSTSNLWR